MVGASTQIAESSASEAIYLQLFRQVAARADSVWGCLPSSPKLYTLRGVSAVYQTVTSIRNLRTPPSDVSFGPGERGLYAVTSILNRTTTQRLRTKSAGLIRTPAFNF
jgi:hypothetical protein